MRLRRELWLAVLPLMLAVSGCGLDGAGRGIAEPLPTAAEAGGCICPDQGSIGPPSGAAPALPAVELSAVLAMVREVLTSTEAGRGPSAAFARGELVVVGTGGQARLPLATSTEAWDELLSAARRDQPGSLVGLLSSGRVLMLDRGTRARVVSATSDVYVLQLEDQTTGIRTVVAPPAWMIRDPR